MKLGDFGLADIGDQAHGTYGTPSYVAPEVILSDMKRTKYDRKADMWSLGATLYEILTGDYLVPKAKNQELCLNPTVKWYKVQGGLKECADVVKNLLARDPKQRLSSSDFLSDIQKIK